MPQFNSKKFRDFVKFYDESNPKHVAAFDDLYAQVIKGDASLMTDEANWVRVYRTEPKVGAVLNVPYYSQRDNVTSGNDTASRTCFSSSCAMAAKFLNPKSITGDDDYIKKRQKYGDTTDASAQIACLKSLGLNAKFSTNGSFSTLDTLLSQGFPVPIGILHHGPASAPSGGGHWLVVIGKEVDAKAPDGCWYVVNDPFGELNNATGVYSSTNGAKLKYSKKMLSQRWTVEGPGSGWCVIFS
jgi:hypothetical protein